MVSTSPRLSESPGFIALALGDARVEVVPRQGGRVRSLCLGGHEWLPVGAGWEECDGGARLRQPETTVAADAEGQRVTCTWRGETMPWVLSRTLLVRADGAVEARYEALTTGHDRLPFLWSAQLLFPLTARTRVRIPDGGRLRVAAVKGAALTGNDAKDGAVPWPRLSLDEKPRDLGEPWSVPRRTLLSAWIDLGGGRSMVQLWQGDEQLTLTFDGAGVPYCGLVIDRPRREITLGPSLGAPAGYEDMLGDRQAVTWLAPGEPRRWTMTLRGPGPV